MDPGTSAPARAAVLSYTGETARRPDPVLAPPPWAGISDDPAFLTALFNKTLRVLATDGRMFVGQFKCTDHKRNIVLATAYEYRDVTRRQTAAEAPKAASLLASTSESTFTPLQPIGVSPQPRYLGLIVVPGIHVVRVEVEEFASQLKVRPPPVLASHPLSLAESDE